MAAQQDLQYTNRRIMKEFVTLTIALLFIGIFIAAIVEGM